jgi:hypothetical protein
MPNVLIEVDEKDLQFIEQVAKLEKRDRKWQITKILEDYVKKERAKE